MFPGPKNRKEPVVDNDRMLSLTGGGERNERGKEGKRAQKVTVLFTLEREGERRRGIIGVKDRVAKRAENGQANERTSLFCSSEVKDKLAGTPMVCQSVGRRRANLKAQTEVN